MASYLDSNRMITRGGHSGKDSQASKQTKNNGQKKNQRRKKKKKREFGDNLTNVTHSNANQRNMVGIPAEKTGRGGLKTYKRARSETTHTNRDMALAIEYVNQAGGRALKRKSNVLETHILAGPPTKRARLNKGHPLRVYPFESTHDSDGPVPPPLRVPPSLTSDNFSDPSSVSDRINDSENEPRTAHTSGAESESQGMCDQINHLGFQSNSESKDGLTSFSQPMEDAHVPVREGARAKTRNRNPNHLKIGQKGGNRNLRSKSTSGMAIGKAKNGALNRRGGLIVAGTRRAGAGRRQSKSLTRSGTMGNVGAGAGTTLKNSLQRSSTVPRIMDSSDNGEDSVEMEDRMVSEIIRKWGPWDEPDLENELATVFYVDDVVRRLFAIEERHTVGETNDYMQSQTDLSERMRTILLDWLIDVHRKFELRRPTLYLCVNILDRFLAVQQVHRSDLQLTGCACLWIASKYHEIYAPEIRDFVYISDDAFNENQLIAQESLIVSRLQFNLTVATPLSFIDRFLKIGCWQASQIATKGGKKKPDKIKRDTKIARWLTNYLSEHALMSYALSRTTPSKVACACVAYVLLGTKMFAKWPDQMVQETRYTIHDLQREIKVLDKFLKIDAKKCKHKAVRKKYTHRKVGQVAKYNFKTLNVNGFFR